MKRLFTLAASIILLQAMVAGTWAQEPPAKLKVTVLEPTVFMGIDATGKELVVRLTKTVTVCRPETVTRKVKDDSGKEKTLQETVLITETKQVQEMRSHKIDTAKVFRGDGTEIPHDEWASLMKDKAAIGYAQGEELDPSWKTLLKADTYIVLVPVPAAPSATGSGYNVQKNKSSSVQPVPGLPRMPPTIPIPPHVPDQP